MTEKKQVGTYVREDLYQLLQAEKRSNTEIFNEALDMYFEAHGEGSAAQIEEQLSDIRAEREDLREEMLARIEELEEREAELEEALAKKRELQSSREDLQQQILEDMAANPAKNLQAYKSEIQDLLAHPDGADTREGVLANLRELASDYDVNIRRLRETGGGKVAAADGDGVGEPDIDPTRYDFDEDNGGSN